MIELDKQEEIFYQKLKKLKNERNEKSSLIGKYKEGIDTSTLMSEMQKIADIIKSDDEKSI